MDELKIIEDIKSGNKKQVAKLVEKYQNYVFRIVIGFVHNSVLAEDITQEVFIKMWQNIDKYKPKAEFKTWLYRVAVNTALNVVRKKKYEIFFTDINDKAKKYTFDDDLEVEYTSSRSFEADTHIENRELKKILKNAINQLPKKQKIAFVLKFYVNLDYKDIAQVMELSYASVDSLIYRAKQNLQKKLLKFKNNEL